MATFGYCRPTNYADTPDCASPGKLYLVTVYWSIGLISGSSSAPEPGPYEPYYSDDLSAFTTIELMLLAIITFIAAVSWVRLHAE